ncbi:bifunctional phosphoribosyl-AMP cyclohydrolase/phosphoribosyl-ATP diphosphatase HisIE [Anaerofustis stercorihominis]|uniref:Histidine biosynthesis bifunctional protein HisIE n=1 Tax=Anaerofustis stercorihominis TaxID=214853 RepID=A0A3E3E0T0_9FIRM|nr:bifunctional phosphoribosyl-AMP cyclohydrolase/phosphoribosyl-ATP diphosphatase HisIE [Anaerofustis stercorihominis]RGD75157.1 bifunctional phosphoribosyl-AMP cyclohydrolase/phosphoribosyl-ATP diphosphatase HisIE [Anaerofustis stercorihominis]
MDFKDFKLDDSGLLPVIVQNYKTGKVLMLGYMNEEAYNNTLKTGKVNFYSRSRKTQWLKGETSGNFLNVVSIKSDCDNDTLLVNADPVGPTCHTGSESCFFNDIVKSDKEESAQILFTLQDTINQRKEDIKKLEKMPTKYEGSYTQYLLIEGTDKICKKIGEESAETIIAAKNDDEEEIICEASDLIYHLLVLLNDRGVKIEDIFSKLNNRHK